MAQLSIEVGPLSSSRSASNVKAAEILRKFAANTGYTGPSANDQAVLDHCTSSLADYLVAVANRQERAEAAAVAAKHGWSA